MDSPEHSDDERFAKLGRELIDMITSDLEADVSYSQRDIVLVNIGRISLMLFYEKDLAEIADQAIRDTHIVQMEEIHKPS